MLTNINRLEHMVTDNDILTHVNFFRTASYTPVDEAVSGVAQGIMGMSVAQSVTVHFVPAPYGTTGNTTHWLFIEWTHFILFH